MPRSTRTSLVLAVVLVTALAVPTTAATEETTGSARVIVELTAAPALTEVRANASWDRASDRAAGLRRTQDAVLGAATDADLGVSVVHRLTAAYAGLVVDLPADRVKELADLDGVKAVHPDTSYVLTLANSVPLVGAPQVWDTTDADGRAVTGTGTTVAIVDSGVDYTHPDLGGGFGKGHKVVAGYDLVNDDPDPMDDNGHGTHVAGIVAADGAVRGVAPGATLTAYKVMNRGGSGLLSDIIAGLDAAVAPDNPHRADIVNLSLSGPGDGTDPLSTAVRNAVDAGVVVAVSAGNSGPGAQSVQSPAAAEGALAVGASASGVWVPRVRMVAPAEQDLRAVRAEVSAAAPRTPLRTAVVDVGEGRPADYEGVDVTGKTVLVIDNGDAYGLAADAQARGAVAALVYTPDYWRREPAAAGPLSRGPVTDPAPGAEFDEFATGAVDAVDDGRLESVVVLRIPGASASTLQSHLDDKVEVEIAGSDGTDRLADFSSRGPTAGFTAKPDLVAPGVEIVSTLPGGRHGRVSGTSMAAPHVAGAAALLRQRHPGWTAAQVGAALVGTAWPLTEAGAGPLAQGAGRLDVSRAAAAEVLATPTTLSFGLADVGPAREQVTDTAQLTLENLGTETTPLKLTAHVEGGAGTVAVEPAEVSVAPGGKTTVAVRLTAGDTTADTDITGWVEIDGHGRVPFLLSVRHLTVHVTPDPVPTGAQTTLFVRSPAPLSAEPELVVSCPGLRGQRPDLTRFGTNSWRAVMTVGDAGRCDATVTGTATYGAAALSGAAAFEVAAPPRDDNGVHIWQQVGPNAEAGLLAFGTDRHDRRSTTVVPSGSPGVFVTDDRMGSWRELHTMPMSGGSATDVEVDPRDSDAMYVAMSGGAADPSYEGRIVHTADGGRSWQVLPGWDTYIDELALDPTGRALVVSGGGTVRLTRDEGATWAELPSVGRNPRDLAWIGSDLYAATNSGLVVIRDALGPAPAGPEVLYKPGVLGWAGRVTGDRESIFVTAYPSAWVYASHDGGATFQLALQATGTSFQALELDGDTLYGVSGRGVWVGHDRGATWEQWGDPMPPSVETDIARWPAADGDLYVASHGAGVYRADAPGDYERMGIPAARVYDLTVARGTTGPVLVAGTYRDTFRLPLTRHGRDRPPGSAWESGGGEGLVGVAAEYLAVSPTDPSVVYKVSKDPTLTFSVRRSSDGGATWERVSQPSEFPSSLLVHPADPDRVYAGYASLTSAGLVVSTDGGGTWRKLDQGRVFRALAGDPVDPDRVWAGDHEGLYRSDDGGVTFERLAGVPVTAIAADPDRPGHLTVGGRTLYTSTDGGETLVPANTPGLDMWVTDLLYEPGPGRRVFASAGSFYDEFGVVESGRGVLRSDDDGASWVSMSAGLANPNVTSLALDPDRRHLYAGTYGGSVHRITLPR